MFGYGYTQHHFKYRVGTLLHVLNAHSNTRTVIYFGRQRVKSRFPLKGTMEFRNYKIRNRINGFKLGMQIVYVSNFGKLYDNIRCLIMKYTTRRYDKFTTNGFETKHFVCLFYLGIFNAVT